MNPASFSLLVFSLICLLVWLFFRPNRGWYYRLVRWRNMDDRTIAEDILKLIYHSDQTDEYIDDDYIAEQLKVPKNRVKKVLKDLELHHLIEIRRGQIDLTPDGNSYALRVIRVHRLYEKYLAEHTGFDETEWHDKAEQMEHKLSEYEANQLSHELRMPVYDPHGDPIPDKYGEIQDRDSQLLTTLEEDDRAKIIHIEDEPLEVYQQILAEKLHVGSTILLIENSPNRLVFHSAGEEIIMAPSVAKSITVVEIDPEDAELEDAIRLSALKAGESGSIIKINSNIRGLSRRRLLDLGFVKGSKISIDLKNPLGDPTAYRIKESAIALRENLADNILIKVNK